jgi:Ser/Thr protein kinase RdoA (MazF antagonist)
MNNILLRIAKQFDKNAASVEFFTECRNLIYKVNCLGYFIILRLVDQKHRNKEQIESELDFQKYLFYNGADVVNPLITEGNESCLSVEINNSNYWASAFEYANGNNWYDRTDSSKEIFQSIGKVLGKIHRLSKEYSLKKVVKRRLWNEQQELIKADKLFKNYSMELYNKFIEYIQYMDASEKSSSNFGLTHGDYLQSNYLIDDKNRVTVIDFDECEYSWFAADLAICMRCYLIGDDPMKLSQKAAEAEMIHYNLLLGYKSENSINEEMVFGLDKYFRIRDFIELSQLLELLSQGKTLCDVENKLLDTCLDRILNNKPFLIFDTRKTECLLQ